MTDSERVGAKPPNILLFLADDLGYEAIGCYGGLEIETPNADRLAAQGVRFDRAYACAVCTPSRMSLLTGAYVPRHGHSKVLPIHEGYEGKIDFQNTWPTYAQQLHRAGYETSVTGKWQLGALEHTPDHPREAGFDSWCCWQIMKNGKKQERYWPNACINRDGKIMEGIEDRFGPDVLADYVIERMKKATAAGKPFLIHHNEMLPHDPNTETPDDKAGVTKPRGRWSMVQYLDKLLGRLMNAVDGMGIADNTLIVFAGDNGSHLGGNARTRAGTVKGGKWQVETDAGTHVPFICRWPATIAPGRVCGDFIEFADFFPTMCELVGIKPELPEGFKVDGVSFAAPLLGTGAGSRRIGTGNGLYAFDGDWRLHPNGKLYDCRKLPEEAPANPDDPEARAARERLQPTIESLAGIRTFARQGVGEEGSEATLPGEGNR